MSSNQDCVNARLVRFEQGAFSDIPDVPSEIPKPYYFAYVFVKGGREYRHVFTSNEQPFDLGRYLPYIGKVVKSLECSEEKTVFIFTDGTWISMS